MKELLFVFFAVITVVSAGIVSFSRNLIYSVFSLMATFIGVAALYVFLAADFIALAQIMVYVGGILVLLIFGVMLTQKISTVTITHLSVNRVWIVFLGLLLLGGLGYTIFNTSWFTGEMRAAEPTVKAIGNLLMGKYLLAFEVASVLLLGALIGAATIARKEEQ
ncbi:MAG TPA: NADH-quinone oxidoreductase subunit J [Candidatus Marinimicrobia bacterium]|nr:NADH-quinone oxidoreductase subunit J [Candidatus Neomarinimicrobiota bacterium]